MRRAVGLIGGAVAALGLVALVFPSVTAFLPTTDPVVVLLAVLLVLGGISQVQRRRSTELVQAETGDVEVTVDLPTPGDDFDERLGHVRFLRNPISERTRIRNAVADTVTDTIQRRTGCSRERAIERLQAGTWTDDPVAAAVFSNRSARRSWLGRLRRRIDSESTFRRQIRRVLEAAAGMIDGEADPPTAGTGSDSTGGADRSGGDDGER